MTFTPCFNGIATNGTTPVTVVAAPGERTQRIVKRLIINNKDSGAVVATVKHVTSGGSSFTIASQSIASLANLELTDLILDKTTQSITVVLSGAVAATEPDCTAHFADLGP